MSRTKREKGPRLPAGDDGRTIASMNVEGMPWYVPERPDMPPPTQDHGEEKGKKREFADGLTRKQARMYTWSAMKAGLLVAGVMALGMAAFVAFCVYVWFR